MECSEYGVPQGAICGPLLFLICFKYIHELGLKGHITLYADDTCLFYIEHTIEPITQGSIRRPCTFGKYFNRSYHQYF